MSHRQILLPPPTVEDPMDDVALTPYNRPESAFNFRGWQDAPQRGLPALLSRSPSSVAAAPSTDSSSEAVIHSVPLQFQPQRCEGTAPVRSQEPTPSNAEFQGLRDQLQHLQHEKEAALAQVQKLQNQQAVNTGLLQRTAADVENTAITSAAHQAQLSSSVSSQLDNITEFLNTNFVHIDEDLKKSFCDQNLIYNTLESRHQKCKQRFASIEAQLARLGMNPQAATVQSPQPHRIQYHAVPLLEQGVAIVGPPPPPVPPLSRHVYNASPSPPPQRYPRYQPDMVAGKAPPSSKFRGNMKDLEGWMLQMDDYFTITQTRNEVQRLAYVGLCTEGDALEW